VPLKGKIEVFNRRYLSGWIAEFGDRQIKPRLELLLDGEVILSTPANELREDVQRVGFGDGLCEYQMMLPEALTAHEMARVKLRIAESDLYLELPRAVERQCAGAAKATTDVASPVFIVGSPRSGTSILTRALATAGYHGFQEGNLLGLGQVIDRDVDWFFDANNTTSHATLLANVNRTALKADLFLALKQTIDNLNPVSPWFDKTGNPETILLLPRIMEAWPNSRVIFAKRRGVENVISRLQKFPDFDFRYHCKDWAANMRAWRETRGSLDQARITEVDQNEILVSPDVVAARLGAFLGLSSERSALAERTLRIERPQETSPGSAARAIRATDTHWTDEQRLTFETLCGEEMQVYGYSYP
jgi:hypothetical protein